MIEIKSMPMLQTNSVCQYDCNLCVTEIARKSFPKYQLSIKALKKFLHASEDSGYLYKNGIWLNGFGEPLLWKNLNEGIGLLHNSPSINGIYIRSNGLAYRKLTKESFKKINLSISLYAGANDYIIPKINDEFKTNIEVVREEGYNFSADLTTFPLKIPCNCACSGPTIIEDHIILPCGSVIFEKETLLRAVKSGLIKAEDFASFLNMDYMGMIKYAKQLMGESLVVKIENNYLDQTDKNLYQKIINDNKERAYKACSICWGNRNGLQGHPRKVSIDPKNTRKEIYKNNPLEK
jgi:hypothetical protein